MNGYEQIGPLVTCDLHALSQTQIVIAGAYHQGPHARFFLYQGSQFAGDGQNDGLFVGALSAFGAGVFATVAGIDPEQVKITFEGDVLTITGELPAPLENVEYLMRERRYGPFSRSLTFNVPVDADKIEATFDNGVLNIVVPKAETIKPKTIKVLAK